MKKKRRKYKKTIKKKWNDFLVKFKKAVLISGIVLILIFVVPAFIPTEYVPDMIENRDRNVISELHIFDDALDGFQDTVRELQNILDEFFEFLKAVDRTLFSGEETAGIQLDEIPAYKDEPYVVIHNNVPSFSKEEITDESYEYYSELDLLGRCGVTMACIGKDLMPTEERGAIGMIKPSGWKLKKYDIVDGKYIYNRCHLIGFQLTGENANEKNLITGTRYLNVEGMLPFENQVAEYIRKTGNHVMYRVTPIFEENNLVASGVQMEAYSVEDKGIGVSFNVYIYNIQPGIEIDYATGENWLKE